MKKEVEVKILNVDRKKLRATLKGLKARQTRSPTRMREVYWGSPSEQRAYSSLRLRSEGGGSFLTLKVKKEDTQFHVRGEFEVRVSDFRTARRILELAGFKVFREREKIREEFQVGRVKVAIDTYPRMKPYMEIEASSKKEVKDFLGKIGFPLIYTTSKTATEIIRDAGLNPDDLLFHK